MNPYNIEPNRLAPRNKAAVLLGRLIVATAWVERGDTFVKLERPMTTPGAMRHIADAVDGWANASR